MLVNLSTNLLWGQTLPRHLKKCRVVENGLRKQLYPMQPIISFRPASAQKRDVNPLFTGSRGKIFVAVTAGPAGIDETPIVKPVFCKASSSTL